MFKNLLTILCIVLFSRLSYGQCAVENWSLEKRTQLASLIVEGKVIDQYAFRESGRNTIYTASVIEVYKLFKGKTYNPYKVEIITFGGQIGLEKHQANPELELQTGDVGLFLLNDNRVNLPESLQNNGIQKFQGTASTLSFLSYDYGEDKVYDLGEYLIGISNVFYTKMEALTGNKFLEIKKTGFHSPSKLKPTAGPVINSFVGASATSAGTGYILTIKGSNFGAVRGNGRVEFLDANFGDGRRVKTPYPKDYTLWSDTMVSVRIPTRAGTGTVKIATNDSTSTTSSSSFNIHFSHLNVGFKTSATDSAYYTTDLISDNGKGGYTLQFNTRFKANTNMVNAFLKAMETWRCGTLVNWEIGRDTSIKVVNGDGVNIVKLTKFTDNKLAVCYSFWQGCYVSGSNMEWFVNEMDIEADSSRNWYYGSGNPSVSQYDFQSVLAHELGHGHQLGHVISSNEMMHYSIGAGQKKSSLSSNDLSGGLYVKNKSIVKNNCSGTEMKALTQSLCGYTKPQSGFSTSKVKICPGNQVVYTDTSSGLIKSYTWSFGTGASPSTATSKGPHTVTYSQSGWVDVSLIISNDFGQDTTLAKNLVQVMPDKPSAPVNLTYDDTACLGAAVWTVDTLRGDGSLVWKLPTEASATFSNKNSLTLLWKKAGGPYPFSVKAVNFCGSSDSVAGQSVVLNNPIAAFTKVENGRTVSFTNASQFASAYKWYFGDGDSSSLTNPVHTYPIGKAYNANLKAINKCRTSSLSLIVNPFHPASTLTIDPSGQFVFPNPTRDVLYLSDEIANYELFDALGKPILSGAAREINLSQFSSGIYFLSTYIYNGKSKYFKIIKN